MAAETSICVGKLPLNVEVHQITNFTCPTGKDSLSTNRGFERISVYRFLTSALSLFPRLRVPVVEATVADARFCWFV
jgi:hypothetical protein